MQPIRVNSLDSLNYGNELTDFCPYYPTSIPEPSIWSRFIYDMSKSSGRVIVKEHSMPVFRGTSDLIENV